MSASSSSAAGAAPSAPASIPAAASSSLAVAAAAHAKKTKASTSSAPSSAPTPWLLLLPDVTRDLLFSYLKNKNVSHFSAGCKCLLGEYGNRRKTLRLTSESLAGGLTLSSLLRFTERQKHLTKVELHLDDFLPLFFLSLGAGYFRHLKVLELDDIRLLASTSSIIGAMIAKDAMQRGNSKFFSKRQACVHLFPVEGERQCFYICECR